MVDEMLTIGDLARRTGVAPSALRYYQERGLLRPVARISGHRRYSPDAVGVVGTIIFLADVGFTLAEINELMTARSGAPRSWHSLARRKLDELNQHIAQVQAARVAIEHALVCPQPDIVACPNFQDVIRRRLAGTPLDEVHHR